MPFCAFGMDGKTHCKFTPGKNLGFAKFYGAIPATLILMDKYESQGTLYLTNTITVKC